MLPTQFHFQRGTQEYNKREHFILKYRTITFYGLSFQRCFSNKMFCKLLLGLTAPRRCILLPPKDNHSRKEQIDLLIYNADSEIFLYQIGFRLDPRSFATTKGITFVLFSSGY